MKRVSPNPRRGNPGLAKCVALVLTFVMIVSSFAATAFTPMKSRDSVSQLSLVSVKAVDVSSTITGIRNYTDIAESQKYYQANEVIYVAVTVEVKNLAKSSYGSLESIDGKNIEISLGSDDVDLSYAKTNAPTVLSYIYSGDVGGNIGTVATAMLGIGNVVSYNKKYNEVSFVITGTPLYQTGSLNSLNIGAKLDEKGRIVLPALKAKDGATNVQIGSTIYEMAYSAPDALQYTVLFSGVARDLGKNTTAGGFYAKMMLENAERFTSYGSYYIKSDGTMQSSKPSEGAEYVDYIGVDVEKLSIKNGYNVYRYFVPSSGLYNVDVPIKYLGDDSSYKDKVLSRVNPNLYDKSTNKSETTVNVAGGVRSAQARKINSVDAKTTEVPLSSIVYTSNASFYAPSFYAGVVNSETKGEVVEKDVEIKPSEIKQTKDVQLAQTYTGVVTYDRPYGDNFDYERDITLDLGGRDRIYIGLNAAKQAWADDSDPDKPAEFDPKKYPYIVFSTSEGGADAVGVYTISLNSAEKGAKTKVTVSLNVGGDDETKLNAFENWTPEFIALNAIETIGGTTFERVSMDLTSKKDSVQTWYEPGFMSGKLDYADSQFDVTVKAQNGTILVLDKDYKLVKSTKDNLVVSIGIIPIPESDGNLPAWASDEIFVKVSYLDPEAGTSNSASETTDKADDALLKDVVGRNGIAAYIITTYSDDTPVITLTSEDTYFSSDIGSGIASFDDARRIYHTSAKNFIYADSDGGNVSTSSLIANAYRYFDLDTGFGSSYKLQAEVFEQKGANAAYSDRVTGTFKFGTVNIEDENVNESTEEDELVTDENLEEPEPEVDDEEDILIVDDGNEEDALLDDNIGDDIEEEEEEGIPPTEPSIPATGDFGMDSGVIFGISASVLMAGFFAITHRIKMSKKEDQ